MTQIKEVTFDRIVNAPVAKVWEAWTDAAQLTKWWGPDHTTIEGCTVDLRIGGKFSLVMVADKEMGEYAGTRWPMEATYTVIEEQAKLSFDGKGWTEGAEATTQIDQTTELVLTEQDGKTRMQLRAAIHKLGSDAGMAAEGMQYGFAQQFDKLDQFLAQ